MTDRTRREFVRIAAATTAAAGLAGCSESGDGGTTDTDAMDGEMTPTDDAGAMDGQEDGMGGMTETDNMNGMTETDSIGGMNETGGGTETDSGMDG